MAATIKGIDVSMYQTNVDFAKVKAAGYSFVIIRCNNWDDTKNCVVKDPLFETHYKNAKAAGLDVGAYYYTWQTTVSGAKQDAVLCLDYIKGKTFEYPIYFDLEWQKAFARGKTVCSDMVKTFCTALEEAGYFAGLYISRSPLQTYITNDVARRYALWIAEYNSKCNYGGTYGMWQYSSTGKVSGVSVPVDMDYCYVDYPSVIKAKGLNGFKATNTSTSKVLDSSGFKKGDKSDGVLALKQLLMLAGYKLDNNGTFGDGTLKAVNALLKKWGYTQNGIAGTKFIKKLSVTIK
ncbi:glycoside hydrolase [Ruminococcus sp. AF16-50]|jgi:lysozyme|nr:glycoside hydrolase [Ruminococcus sp. AF25-19]RGG93713.1 glycoside hydrolase [Ruminococcus sp. AF16-50]